MSGSLTLPLLMLMRRLKIVSSISSSIFSHSFKIGIVLIAVICHSTPAFPNTSYQQSHEQYPVRLLHQFSNTNRAENLAVTSNGSPWIDTRSPPDLLIYDPSTPFCPSRLLHSFADAGYTGTLSIIETSAGVFDIVTGNDSLEENKPIPGSFAIWTISLPPHDPIISTQLTPQIQRLTDLPSAQFINGLIYHSYPTPAVLVDDSTLGTITRVGLATGFTSTLISDDALRPCDKDAKEGINGFHIQNATLYYTNSNCRIFGTIPVHPDGSAAGPATVRAYAPGGTLYFFDDFAQDAKGKAYVAISNGDGIAKIAANGEVTIVAGSVHSSEIAETTALAWGRREGLAEIRGRCM